MSSPYVIRKRCAVNIDSYCLVDPAAHGRQLSDPDHVQGDLNKVTIARVCSLICFKWVSKVSARRFLFFFHAIPGFGTQSLPLFACDMIAVGTKSSSRIRNNFKKKRKRNQNVPKVLLSLFVQCVLTMWRPSLRCHFCSTWSASTFSSNEIPMCSLAFATVCL